MAKEGISKSVQGPGGTPRSTERDDPGADTAPARKRTKITRRELGPPVNVPVSPYKRSK
jgi:hypothetical protein